MAFAVQLLILSLVFSSGQSEVSQDFAKCKEFFYRGNPPGFTGSDLKDICQHYQRANHFATTYSTHFKIPVFSAYLLPKAACRGDQPERRNTWFVEPQVSGRREADMKLAGQNTQDYKPKQAINTDYRNTGFDRGHLNPYFYQCNDGRTATFTLTNSVPQNPCFNEQVWKVMEAESKKIMESSCAYPGAKRLFVTGTVPTEKMIPDEIHDKEGDRRRDYKRVSVPSQMWTAACCDTTACPNPSHKSKGFSYGYIGKNTADPEIKVFSVRDLETSLTNAYRYVNTVNFGMIFSDDKCNINEEESKKARKKIVVPLAKMMTNEVHTMTDSQISSLPPKKRKLIGDQERTFQSSKYSKLSDKLTFSNADFGMKINPRKEIFERIRETLLNDDFSLLLTARGCSSLSSPSLPGPRLKRNTNEIVCNQPSLYTVVRKQSKDAEVTTSGVPCRLGHKCGKHGKSYLWCYTDWSNNWEYCCSDDCDFRGSPYMWCKDGNKWQYCSQRSSVITISGKRCLSEHECGVHGEKYYWCYTDLNKNWDYCCQPWDPCYDRIDGSKWCYTGRSRGKNRKNCN